MAQKRRGLGRGLEALIPDSQKESVSARRPSDVFFPDSDSTKDSPAQDQESNREESSSRTPQEERRSGSDLSTLLTPPKRARGSRSRRTTTGEGGSSAAGSRRASSKKSTVSRETATKKKSEAGVDAAVEAPAEVAEETAPAPAETTPEEMASTEIAAVQHSESAEADLVVDAVEKNVVEEPAVQDSASEAPHTAEETGAEPGVSRETEDESSSEDDSSDGLVPVPGASFADLSVELIHPNPRQPRQVFDEEDIAELAASIREVGLLQPIVVRRAPSVDGDEPHYELIMGERRLRASKEAGMETIPAVVRETDDVDLLRDALLENLHRVQLNPLEEAAAYQQLLEDFHCTHAELSDRIARSRSQISNTLRLMKLPPLVQRRLAAGVISAGHARALLGLPNAAVMERLAQRIVAEGLSVRATEELVALQEEPEGGEQAKVLRARSTPLPALSTRLSDTFDTRVKVTRGAKKGRITIEFAGDEDLARIVDALAPGTSLDEE